MKKIDEEIRLETEYAVGTDKKGVEVEVILRPHEVELLTVTRETKTEKFVRSRVLKACDIVHMELDERSELIVDNKLMYIIGGLIGGAGGAHAARTEVKKYRFRIRYMVKGVPERCMLTFELEDDRDKTFIAKQMIEMNRKYKYNGYIDEYFKDDPDRAI